MRIATWNVNSLRSRIDRVEALPPAARRRRARAAGDQGARGPAAADGPAGRGVRDRRRGHQPVERRRDHQPGRARRRARSASTACRGRASRWRPRRARSARPAAAYGSGRSTCPTAASPTTRTTSTSSTGWPGCARRPAAWMDGPDRAGRRLEHLPDRRRRLRPGAVHEQHARHAAGARGVPGVPRRRVRRGDPRPRAGLHLLGLLPPALRARPRPQDRLRARDPAAGRRGSPARSSTARSGPGRAPPTTPRWSWTSPTDRGQQSIWKVTWSTQVTVCGVARVVVGEDDAVGRRVTGRRVDLEVQEDVVQPAAGSSVARRPAPACSTAGCCSGPGSRGGQPLNVPVPPVSPRPARPRSRRPATPSA